MTSIYIATAVLPAVGYTAFWKLRPPNMRRARHASCLCACCENFSCYEEGLKAVRDILEGVYNNDEKDEVDDADEPDPLCTNALYNVMRLLHFIHIERCVDKVVKECLCPDAFENQNEDCINCQCDACGFKKIWSEGLRKQLLREDGQLKMGVNPVWLKEVTWSRYKTVKETASSAANEDADKEEMKQQRRGTLIAFLDEFEHRLWPKYPYHRYTLHRTRESAEELRQNTRQEEEAHSA